MEVGRSKSVFVSPLPVICLLLMVGCGSGDGVTSPSNTPFGNPPPGGQSISLNDGIDQNPSDTPVKSDCENKLPCVWLSPDAGLIVTLESVDTATAANRLELRYSLQTTRDTKIKWLPSVLLIDESSKKYTLTSTEIGSEELDAGGSLSSNIFAGARLGVRQTFRESPEHSIRSVARYAISFIEADLRHQVEFINLPIDGESGEEIDCQFKRPCSWVSPNKEYRVTIVLAESPLTGGRLTLHYQIEAFEDITMLVGTDSIAVDSQGIIYTPKTHTVGSHTDYLEFEVPLFADSVTASDLTFFRAAETAAAGLKKLKLNISQDNTELGGSPQFVNVPLD